MMRYGLIFGLLTLFACSPENEFLNSTQKRQVTEFSDKRYQDMLPLLEERCELMQDSLQPYLIDSLLNARIRDMNRKLHQ
ncbi:MAG: hypothetical protein K9I85_12670 [Saprospiraceae bacterium]|nr:hypothetical protein [Saprospiraceae bacterium]